ncbi:VanZ family protein [Kitasatospora sp. McL0602]|uniref:VanZ family protein n=1 Tax=Kitasatospora sp. McL0602 TaxID=3439530 RepID=UPI003F8B82AC
MHGDGATRKPGCGTDNPSAPAVSPRLRAVGVALLALHLCLLTWLSLRPLAVGWTYPANLTPFASVGQAFRLGGLAGAEQLAAGLLPLAPLGLLLPLAGGRLRAPMLLSFLRTVGGAALLATGLEIFEGWTPGHVLNVDDIVLGTLGVALCHLSLVPLSRAVLLRRLPPETKAHTASNTAHDPRGSGQPATVGANDSPARSLRTFAS